MTNWAGVPYKQIYCTRCQLIEPNCRVCNWRPCKSHWYVRGTFRSGSNLPTVDALTGEQRDVYLAQVALEEMGVE